MAQRKRWKGPPTRHEKNVAERIVTVTFGKVPLDKEFTYVGVRYRKTVTERMEGGASFRNAVALEDVTPREIWMDDKDVVTIVRNAEIAWNEW